MKYICTRFIDGNRGDLLSRFGILSEIQKIGINKSTTVMCLKQEHLMRLDYNTLPYGKLFNTIPSFRGFLSLIKSDFVLWTGGLDLSDDSSILKLIYIFINFIFYRILGLKIFVLNQGAGPIKTKIGALLIKKILKKVDIFIARDLPSLTLLHNLNPKVKYFHGFDGIFAGDFVVQKPANSLFPLISPEFQGQLIIGLNIREWFHFTQSMLPNYLKRNKSNDSSLYQMMKFIDAAVVAVKLIRSEFNAKIILISAYEFESCPSDDELKYLQLIKQKYLNDINIQIVDYPLSLQEYIYAISEMDLMIGTRLHCTLTALRLGVPAINLNYTLKGRDIFGELGLSQYILELLDFIQNPVLLISKIKLLLEDSSIKEKINESVKNAITKNNLIYNEVFKNL